MNFKTELSKWGYNKGNSIDVEILINEILPNLFSQQERSYSEEDMLKFGKYLLELSNSVMSRKFNIGMLDLETGTKLTKDLFEQFKKK
jgi:hypothetical protein